MISSEAIREYIKKRTQYVDDFKAKLKAQDNEFCRDLISDFPIRKGTIIKRTYIVGSYRPTNRVAFYKVVDYEATPDGVVTLICHKRKVDGEYGIRDIKLLSLGYYNNFAIPTDNVDTYEIVDGYM